jgi:DNA-binding transcriptional ArsR family regulator
MNAQIVDIDDPRLVKALAHPIRMKILNILDQKTATPKELAEHLGLPLENVSYHVRTLKDFGFIKLEKTRQVRGAVEHHYRMAARPVIGDKLWEQIPRVVQEALVDAQLDVVVETLGQAALQGAFDRADAHLSRWSLVVDEDGVGEIAKILEKAQFDVAEAEKRAQARLKDDGQEARKVTAAVFLFETPQPRPAEPAEQRRDAAARRRAQKSTA